MTSHDAQLPPRDSKPMPTMKSQSAATAPATGLPATDLPTTNAQTSVPTLREDLEFTPQSLGSDHGFRCFDPQHGKHFHVGAEEFWVMRGISDGLSVPEVISRLAGQGHGQWNANDIQSVIRWFSVQGLLRAAPSPSPPRPPRATLWQLPSKLISCRIPLVDAQPLAHRLTRVARWAFAPWSVLAWTGLVASAIYQIATHQSEAILVTKEIASPSTWLWLATCYLLIKAIHESAHMVAAQRQGVNVGQGGITLFFGMPLVYVDTTAAWSLPGRWQRAQIALAGVYAELAIASACVWIWCASPHSLLGHLAFQAMLIAGPTTLLVNLNPLMRLDGYFVLSDILEIPNLSMHGRTIVRRQLQWLFLGRHGERSVLRGWRRSFAGMYSIASAIYQCSWTIGILVAVSSYWAGLGKAIAALAIVYWIIVPLLRWIGSVWRSEERSHEIRWLCGASLTLIAGTAAIAVAEVPWSRRLPAVVTFADMFDVRPQTTGIVDELLIDRGQFVRKGQLLIRLKNVQLAAEQTDGRVKIAQAQLRRQQAQSTGQVALAATIHEEIIGLEARQSQLDRMIASLEQRAPFDAWVIRCDRSMLLGRMAREGESLITLGQPEVKELVVSIGQEDVDDYARGCQSHETAWVRLHGGHYLQARLFPAAPRASRTLPHPALAATAGGPLAVKPPSDPESLPESMELTMPRVVACLPLEHDSATPLRAGQCGTLFLTTNETVFDRVRGWVGM
jgi:putative peptide zinc metalloprotease protein